MANDHQQQGVKVEVNDELTEVVDDQLLMDSVDQLLKVVDLADQLLEFVDSVDQLREVGNSVDNYWRLWIRWINYWRVVDSVD